MYILYLRNSIVFSIFLLLMFAIINIDMILLETTQDAAGETLEIYFSKELRGTPAMVSLLKSNVEMLERGLAGIPRLLVHDNHSVIWAQTLDGIVISSVAFFLNEDRVTHEFDGTATLSLSYTEPAYRGRGIRPLLQPHFDRACVNENVKTIISIIHINNQSSNAVALKQGYKPHSTIYFRKVNAS